MFTEGNKDEGDYGGGNEDGRKSQKTVILASCLTAAVVSLIIGAVVFISYKWMNKLRYVQPENKEKEAGLHVTQTNHMSQCVDQQKCSAV